jgi:hypothetical protein
VLDVLTGHLLQVQPSNIWDSDLLRITRDTTLDPTSNSKNGGNNHDQEREFPIFEEIQ